MMVGKFITYIVYWYVNNDININNNMCLVNLIVYVWLLTLQMNENLLANVSISLSLLSFGCASGICVCIPSAPPSSLVIDIVVYGHLSPCAPSLVWFCKGNSGVGSSLVAFAFISPLNRVLGILFFRRDLGWICLAPAIVIGYLTLILVGQIALCCFLGEFAFALF
jgi:hypothetical protein